MAEIEGTGTSITQDLLAVTRTLARMAKEEDLGTGDLTGVLLEPEREARFELRLNQPAVLAGRALATEIVGAYDETIALEWDDAARDGAPLLVTPMRLATLTGPSNSVLSVERVLLNFLQRLCGIATLTRRYVDAVAGTGARIYDTRKTTPGWRLLERYAVRCGGAHNHRMGLFDAVLIKDNHLAGIEPQCLAHAVFTMLSRLAERQPAPDFVMVEADTVEQLEELFKVVGIDIILLDNFSLDDLRRAVARRDELGLTGKIELEASGGVTLDTITDLARTGVDRISVGAITHSATAVDLSLVRM